MSNECMKSDAASKIINIITIYEGITFEELESEINKAHAMTCWCVFHRLREAGFIKRDLNNSGNITFSLTDKGKELSGQLKTIGQVQTGDNK